jgi:YD repeat-containing protein
MESKINILKMIHMTFRESMRFNFRKKALLFSAAAILWSLSALAQNPGPCRILRQDITQIYTEYNDTSASVLNFGYDSSGRLSSIDLDSIVFQLLYNANGRLVEKNTDSISCDFSYDGAGRVTSVQCASLKPNSSYKYNYEYLDSGRIKNTESFFSDTTFSDTLLTAVKLMEPDNGGNKIRTFLLVSDSAMLWEEIEYYAQLVPAESSLIIFPEIFPGQALVKKKNYYARHMTPEGGYGSPLIVSSESYTYNFDSQGKIISCIIQSESANGTLLTSTIEFTYVCE